MLNTCSTARLWLILSHAVGNDLKQFKKYFSYLRRGYLPKNLKVNWHAVERDLAWERNNKHARILPIYDPLYPQILKHISDPPPILYAQGDVACLNKTQLAIIGSRNPTMYGKCLANKFAASLCNIGFITTSGLARGIDTASHRGALSHSLGQTIAVLAHGLDHIYPTHNAELALQVVARGCLVSEHAIGVKPLPQYFPKRNRIISGLCLGTLVIQADLLSGSLITARYAIDQGREVFAVPWSLHQKEGRGCNQLISQGAKLIECLEDVVLELEALLNCDIRDKYAGYAKLGQIWQESPRS